MRRRRFLVTVLAALGAMPRAARGQSPGKLRPARFELRINVTTALTLALTLPPSVLARADQLVD